MNFRAVSFLAFLGLPLWLLTAGEVKAQTAVPAQPVDSSQPRSALPVGPTKGPVDKAPVPPVEGPPLSILADSSLRNVLRELAQTWADAQASSPQVPLTLTNAGSMITQLQSNPSWDVVISADAGDVKTMTDKGLLAADGQRSLARNVVVLYGRKALLKDEDPDWFDLVGTEWKKIALGNPDLVESGRVAKRALQKHDLFDEDHQGLYVNAATEALALQVVERDQADAVFVYRTDLAGFQLPGFEVVPLNSADGPPVFYTASVGRLAKNPDGARAFIEYCASEGVREVWTRYGFEMN